MNKETGTPIYALGAATELRSEFSSFLNTDEKSPQRLLANPPYTRYMGWNMLTLDQATLHKGQYWEVKNGERKTLQLHRDGTLIAIAYADSSFLGWGQSQEDFEKNPELNALALVEYTFEFVKLYREVLTYLDAKDKVIFKMVIKDSKLPNGERLLLRPRHGNTPRRFIEKARPLEEDFDIFKTIELKDGTYETKYVAYELLVKVYAMFGHTPDKILWTSTDEQNRKFIDTAQFPD